MNNIDENFEIINLKDGQSKAFAINPSNVIDNIVYVLYDILNGIPRFERLKIPKEKNQSLYGNAFNDFNIGYKNYIVQPTGIFIHSDGTHNGHFDPRTPEQVTNELFVNLTNFEKKLMHNSIIQLKNNRFKLKAMYLNFESAQLNERMNVYSFYNEYQLHKKIGMILYHTSEYELSYATKNPFLI